MDKVEAKKFEEFLDHVLESQHGTDRMGHIIKRIKRFVEYVEVRDPVDQCILAAVGFITHTAEIRLRHAYYENDDFTKIDASKVMIEILQEAVRQFEEAIVDHGKDSED